MTEILFIVQEGEDGYRAKAVGASISTQGDTREELIKNVRAAVQRHYNSPDGAPQVAHLHYVRDETISIGTDSGTPPSISTSEIVAALKGSILKDDDPFGPAAPPEDWEAMR